MGEPAHVDQLAGLRAAFLDRDGVIYRSIIREGKGYAPTTLEEVEILPGVADALDALRAAGLLIVVVTNQPDVGAGHLERDLVERMHADLRARFPIDDIRVCCHVTADRCSCRKPKPGMLLAAAADWGIDLSRSFMVGDRDTDTAAGRAVGCRTELIDYRYDEQDEEMPDVVVSSLLEASVWILAQTGDVRPTESGE